MGNNSGFALRIVATLSLIATLLVNALANILPINGLTTGDVSDLYPNLFTPAGFTFSIWSLIYLLLIGFVVYIWINRKEGTITPLLLPFILSCLLNIGWILSWHFLLPFLSVLIMLVLLITLTYLFLLVHKENRSRKSRALLVTLPITFYFSWICVATIANISAFLVSTGWNGFELSPEIWTVLMMSVAAILSLRILWAYKTSVAVFVTAWALFGILIRWKGSEYSLLQVAAVTLACGLLITTFFFFRKRWMS